MSARSAAVRDIIGENDRAEPDFFRILFDQFSQFDWDTYRSEFVARLPSHMLAAVHKSDPELRGDRQFEKMRARVDSLSPEQWNNPELYPHLHALLRRSPGEPADRSIRNIEFQIGEAELEPDQFAPGFYRRRVPEASVCRIVDGRIVQMPGVIVRHSVPGPFPIFFMPSPGLFTDIVGAEAYNGSNTKFTSEYAREMVDAAASSLARYSPQLYAGFCETIGVVALTGEPDVADRSSFSARMFYAGGIFSSLLRGNVPALVENLIHEYFHQRLWVWWSIESPQDLPPETLMIESPVTRTQKSVRVMVHAFLIYIGVCAYYRFALENEPLTDPAADWVRRRLNRLSAGCADLRELLLESLRPYSASLQLAQSLATMMPTASH